MQITAFQGSPRVGGNTAFIAGKVLEVAATAGATTTLRRLNEQKITPCQACMECRVTGKCRMQDGMSAPGDAAASEALITKAAEAGEKLVAAIRG